MSQIIKRGRELIRISSNNKQKLESSTNDGRAWATCFHGGSSYGEFEDLLDNGKEMLATTSKGLLVSTNGGRSWIRRN